MCPKLIERLSWNGPTVHVCCFMLARASTKTYVSRVQKNSGENLRQSKNSLAGLLVSRGITVYAFMYPTMRVGTKARRRRHRITKMNSKRPGEFCIFC